MADGEADAWDADDFEPEIPVAKTEAGADMWAGEDEDEVKDSWEEEDKGDVGTAIQVKKKKSLKERIAEKEAAKKEEMEKKRLEIEAAKGMSAEDKITDKLRRQKLQEEADLKLACDAFGVSSDAIPRLETFHPQSKADFDVFVRLIKEKVVPHEHSAFYVNFLESLFRDLGVGLDPEDLKRLGSTLNTLANEKTKAQKGVKGKKKKGPKLMAGKADTEIDVDEGGDYGGGEFDDFI